MAITLPLSPITSVVHTSVAITGGTEDTVRFSTTDAAGHFVSAIHTGTKVGNSYNAALTIAHYDGSPNSIRVSVVMPPYGSGLGTGWVIPMGGFNRIQTSGRSGYIYYVEVPSLGSLGYAAAYNNSVTWEQDQTSQVNLASYMGPAVRMSADGKTFYCVEPNGTGWILKKYIAGVATTLSSGSAPGTDRQLSVIGTTLTVFINATLVATVKDSSIASGNPGIVGTLVGGEARGVLLSQGELLGEETIYITSNQGALDSLNRLPIITKRSTDTGAASNLVSGGTNPAAGLTDPVAIANAWLRAKGVVR